MGIIDIAVPTNTVLIVIIMGVTLFLDIVEIKKHKDETVNITIVDVRKAIKNLVNASFSDKNKRPLWNTANSPVPSHVILTKRE